MRTEVEAVPVSARAPDAVVSLSGEKVDLAHERLCAVLVFGAQHGDGCVAGDAGVGVGDEEVAVIGEQMPMGKQGEVEQPEQSGGANGEGGGLEGAAKTPAGGGPERKKNGRSEEEPCGFGEQVCMPLLFSSLTIQKYGRQHRSVTPSAH